MGRNTKLDSRSTSDHSTVIHTPTKEIEEGAEEREDDDEDMVRGMKRVLKEEKPIELQQIMVGHSSHILLAGAGAKNKARELPTTGGIFTHALMEVLLGSTALEKMTYKTLVGEVNKKVSQTIDEWNQKNLKNGRGRKM